MSIPFRASVLGSRDEFFTLLLHPGQGQTHSGFPAGEAAKVPLIAADSERAFDDCTTDLTFGAVVGNIPDSMRIVA